MRLQFVASMSLGLVTLAIVGCSANSAATATLPAATATAPASPTSSGAPAGTRTLTVSGGGRSATLTVEIASTEAQRERGLMGRQQLSDETGMLFLFAANTNIGFWMKDTLIPLDIAYLDANGRVLEIKHGKPLDQTVLTPAQPYRYTLEVAGGWFERQGLGVGATVALPADLPAAR